MGRHQSKPHVWLLVLQSLGVIYGDIGTSPLYTISTIFSNGDFTPNAEDITGACSLILWAIIILVSFKYLVFILMADNGGEGGTLALAALLVDEKSTLSSKLKKAVTVASIFGVGFIIADGFLTPAISVLSAIEGLEVYDDALNKYTILITIVIIVGLFLSQRFGTARVGFAFGPIMLLWFWSLTAIGWYRISQNWDILKAFNPAEGFRFFLHHKTTSFLQLASVFLSVTGLEALYADLGHFGKPAIRLSWLLVTQPAVISNYLGQGAYAINNPSAMSTLFFSSVPKSVYWPMIVLATLATIIASQAMITGCFSIVNQAVSLGFFPPVQIKHTSKKVAGQIFVPEVNYIIMLAVIGVVAGFKKSSAIADAYGVTVCGDMILTTILFSLVMRHRWNLALWKVLPFLLFLIVDLVFFSANLTKVPHGGWFSIVSGSLIAMILLAWYIGQEAVHHFLSTHVTEINVKDIDKWARDTGSIGTLRRDRREVVTLDMIDTAHEKHFRISKVEGTGVFLTPIVSENAPQIFLNMAFRTRSMPSRVIFLTVQQTNEPYVTKNSVSVKQLTNEIIQVIIRTGFAEGKCIIEEKVKELTSMGYGKFVDEDATYYALRVRVKAVTTWIPYRVIFSFYGVLKRLFSGISHNIKTPHDSTVEVGVLVPL